MLNNIALIKRLPFHAAITASLFNILWKTGRIISFPTVQPKLELTCTHEKVNF